MEEIKYFEDQNDALGRKLAELTDTYETDKDKLLRALKVNSYKIKILKLELGCHDVEY